MASPGISDIILVYFLKEPITGAQMYGIRRTNKITNLVAIATEMKNKKGHFDKSNFPQGPGDCTLIFVN